MFSFCFLLGIIVCGIVAESASQFILPTYKPPPQKTVYRRARSADEPLWLYKGDDVERAPTSGDHPYLPSVIDDVQLDPHRRHARSVTLYKTTASKAADRHASSSHSASKKVTTIKKVTGHRSRRSHDEEPQWLNKKDVLRGPAIDKYPTYIDDVKLDKYRRYARSVDSPTAKRGGDSHTTSGGSRDTGATHPGFNRRNTRSLHLPDLGDTFYPTPRNPFNPDPFFPRPRKTFPIYARVTREALPKRKTYDITVPGWNPNAKVNPWQKIKVRGN